MGDCTINTNTFKPITLALQCLEIIDHADVEQRLAQCSPVTAAS